MYLLVRVAPRKHMMTIQAKRLKQALKDAGITEGRFKPKTPSVRTKRYVRNIKGEKRFYEFGSAGAIVFKEYNTPEQLDSLRKDDRVKVVLETENCLYLES